MNDAIDTINHRGFEIEVFIDEHPQNPTQEFDMVGEFVCFHRRYSLSSTTTKSIFHNKEVDDVRKFLKNDRYVMYPLYLFDHSGITISLTPFSCPWDSGQVGWVIVSKKKAVYEWGVKNFTKKVRERLDKCIQGEVQVFNDYLTGNVYGFSIDDLNGDTLDSCWGFYGDEAKEEMINEAKHSIDYSIEEEQKQVSLANLCMAL